MLIAFYHLGLNGFPLRGSKDWQAPAERDSGRMTRMVVEWREQQRTDSLSARWQRGPRQLSFLLKSDLGEGCGGLNVLLGFAFIV